MKYSKYILWNPYTLAFCLNSGICSSTYKKSRWHNESNELGVRYSRKEGGKT